MIKFVSDDEVDEDMAPVAAKKTRGGRRKLVSTAQLRDNDSVPLWIQPFFKSNIVPTILEFYGTVDNPWDRDQGKANFFLDFI
jgi:hypothetical protein